MANDTLMGEKMMRHAIKLLPHAVVKRISEFLDPDPGLDWLFTMWAMDSPASNESERQSKGSPSRRRDLLRELTRACSSDGGMEYLDELLSEYLSLAQGNDASGWQATLLKAAIDHRNIIFIQLLLSCDPRGKIIRMHRLLEDIFTVLPNTNGTSAAVDILTGEEPMYAGLMWDITALQQAIDVSDNHLLCFLLEHVELPLEVLNDSFKYASQKKRGELAAMITSTISLIRWNKSLQGASTLPSIVYKEGELVFVQLPKGVHFWKGTIHRDCLNGTYDVQVVDYSSNPLLLQVEPSQLRPASKASIENRTRVIIEDIARATVTWIVCLASSDVLKRLKNDDFDPLQSAVINNSKKRDDDSDDLDENEDSSESGESESDSDCSSDCDCSDCHSECGSDCDCDVKHSNYTDNEDSNNDPVPAKPLPPIETRVQSDPLYLLPESDDGDRTIRLDADTVLGISSCESLYDDTESLCDEITEFKVVDAILLQAIVSPTEDIEASKSTNPQPAEIAHKVDADVAIVSDNQLTPAVINCPVAWASSTSDLFNTSDLRVGDDVDVRYQGRELYIRGRIVDADANKSGFDILYPDGQKETAVPREYIKQINSNGSKKQPEPQDDPEPQAIKPEAATSDSIASDTYARNTVQHGPSSDTVQPDQSDADLDTCYGNEESEKIASATDDAASNTVNAAGESEENSLISSTPSTEDVTADIPPPSPKIDNNYIVEKSQEILSSPTTEDVTADTPPSPKIDRNNIGYKCCNQCYRLGQEIEVNFLGIGKFHRAKIVHVHADNETYDVAFCNFDQIELGVTPTNIRALRVSTQRMKSLIVGSPSSVLPLDTAISTIESSIASSQIGLDVSHVQPEEIAEKSSEVRRPSRLAQVAPLSVPPPQRSVRTSGNSRAPTRRAGHDSARERQLSSTREIATSGEVEEWRNVDIILNRKRRLLHSITGSVETTKVPWGEEFASIQSLKRFATQHPDVLREHIASQLSGLGLQSKSPSRRTPSSTRATQAQMASARDTLLLVKDLAFLLRQRLSPFFDTIAPVVLPAVFCSERRFLCDTAYEVLEALVTHCSSRKLALVLLQQGVIFNDQDDTRLLNLTSLYVEKCFLNLSASETATLVASEPSKSTSTIAKLLAVLLTSKSIPTRIAIEKSLQHVQRELGDRRYEQFIRNNLDPKKADNILLGEQVSGRQSPSKSPKKISRSIEARSDANSSNGTAMGCQSPSILQRMLQQRNSRVRPSLQNV